MIRSTFLFLPKVKQKKEDLILLQAKDWDEFLSKDIKGISSRSKPYYNRRIMEAKVALRESQSSYFAQRLPSIEIWRLYDEFKDNAVYLDIEASGSGLNSFITVIGLFDGISTKTMIRNYNMDPPALRKELLNYKMIVTFNGSSYDLPLLEKKYPGLLPDIPHLDLRHICSRIGLRGGLKEIESELGISRPNPIIQRLYDGDPMKLWRTYMATGEEYYLDLLVEYNEEDVISLKKIAEYAVSENKKQLKQRANP
jgi:uncharacterized protein